LSDMTTADAEPEPRLITETGIDQRIAEIIEPVITAMDFRLVRVRLSNQNGLTLQVMAERNDGSMNVQDCEAISQAISPVLDVDDPVDKAYSLEVSSPGIDRPMVRKSDFTRWIGHLLKCETSIIVANRKRFRGKIIEVIGDSIRLERDETPPGEDTVVEVPMDAIGDARLMLTDELIAAALKADKAARKARAGNDNDPDDVSGE